MANYLTCSFSPSMLPSNLDSSLIRFKPILPSAVPVDCVSGIENSELARLIGNQVGSDLEDMRLYEKLFPGDTLYVAQYIGPWPQKGATKLPVGASIVFFEVTLLAESMNN